MSHVTVARGSREFVTTEWSQRVQVKNGRSLVRAVMNRPEGTPLVTVANHLSYIDDPAFYRMMRYGHKHIPFVTE